METYEVTLRIQTENGNPLKWDWADLVDEPTEVVNAQILAESSDVDINDPLHPHHHAITGESHDHARTALHNAGHKSELANISAQLAIAAAIREAGMDLVNAVLTERWSVSELVDAAAASKREEASDE